MSTQSLPRVSAGLPAGGQFAPTGHSEADAELGPGAFDCPGCGEPSGQDEGIPCETCLDSTCPCGQSLDDGEGYDGLCGDCADRAYATELSGDAEQPDVDELSAEPEPERLSANMGDGSIVTAPSGEYGFYAPIGGSESDAGVAEHGPVVQVAQLVQNGTAWGATPARYYASGVSDLRPGTALAIDMGAGWKLTPEDSAALATFAQDRLAEARAKEADLQVPVNDRDLEIGRTIYDQIPLMARGNMDAKFANAHAVPNGLKMTRCLAGRRRVDVTVVLNGRDLYDIDVVTTETLRTDSVPVAKAADVHVSQLESLMYKIGDGRPQEISSKPGSRL